jgi:hypothetical protein
MHHAVIAEFGDPNADVSVEAEASQEVVVHTDPDMPAALQRMTLLVWSFSHSDKALRTWGFIARHELRK